MGIKQIFEKLMNKSNIARHNKLSSDEVELASFKERERRDNIKKELAVYRKRNSQELLIGRDYNKELEPVIGNPSILEQKDNILDIPNVFKDSSPINKKGGMGFW